MALGMYALRFFTLLGISVLIFKTKGIEETISGKFELSLEKSSCSGWFKPCSCFVEALTGHIYVTCQYVDASEVFEAFNKPNTPVVDIYSMTHLMKDSNGTTHIPANLIGRSKIMDSFKLKWEGPRHSVLTIDTNAFWSSADSMQTLTLSCFSVQSLEWNFLNNLNILQNLAFLGLKNMENFSKLTTMKSPLNYLMIQNCTGLIDMPQAPGTLIHADFSRTLMSDETARILIERLSLANETLRELSFFEVPLTEVPFGLERLHKVEILNLGYTKIVHLKTSTFPATLHFKGLSLIQSELKEIDAGAFQSNFSGATVTIANTPIQRFEADVFIKLLEDMYYAKEGVLELKNCNFSCDCTIAWLIRDNAHLMDHVVEGTCENSTSFHDLNPAGYVDCETVPTSSSSCGISPTEFPTEAPLNGIGNPVLLPALVLVLVLLLSAFIA